MIVFSSLEKMGNGTTDSLWQGRINVFNMERGVVVLHCVTLKLINEERKRIET